jgi:hypothetical protein
MIASPAKTSG